jgi:hypothetical protein
VLGSPANTNVTIIMISEQIAADGMTDFGVSRNPNTVAGPDELMELLRSLR